MPCDIQITHANGLFIACAELAASCDHRRSTHNAATCNNTFELPRHNDQRTNKLSWDVDPTSFAYPGITYERPQFAQSAAGQTFTPSADATVKTFAFDMRIPPNIPFDLGQTPVRLFFRSTNFERSMQCMCMFGADLLLFTGYQLAT